MVEIIGTMKCVKAIHKIRNKDHYITEIVVNRNNDLSDTIPIILNNDIIDDFCGKKVHLFGKLHSLKIDGKNRLFVYITQISDEILDNDCAIVKDEFMVFSKITNLKTTLNNTRIQSFLGVRRNDDIEGRLCILPCVLFNNIIDKFNNEIEYGKKLYIDGKIHSRIFGDIDNIQQIYEVVIDDYKIID